jgi:hypothetical protein
LCGRSFGPRRFGISRAAEKEHRIMNNEKQDVYARITDKIVADLEKASGPPFM